MTMPLREREREGEGEGEGEGEREGEREKERGREGERERESWAHVSMDETEAWETVSAFGSQCSPPHTGQRAPRVVLPDRALCVVLTYLLSLVIGGQ